MKLVKTQVCLFLYEQFIRNGYIDSYEIKKKFDLSDRTLFRYINEIRCYLCNFFKGEDIVFSRLDNKYYLKSIEEKK